MLVLCGQSPPFPQPLQHVYGKHGVMLRVLSGAVDELWSTTRRLADDHGVRRAMCALWKRPVEVVLDAAPHAVQGESAHEDADAEEAVQAVASRRRKGPRNPFVAAALSEIRRHRNAEEDSYSDLEDFIVCMPGRDYGALLRENFAYNGGS